MGVSILKQELPTLRESVLVVSSDPRESSRLQRVLELHGYHASAAPNAKTACQMKNLAEFVAVFYVAALPDSLYVNEVQLLRLHLWGAPLLAFADAASDDQPSTLLESGADDCIRCGCGDREIVARLRAQQHRVQRLTVIPLFDGRFTLDVQIHRVTRVRENDHVWVNLPPQEFMLIRALSLRPGLTVPHRNLDILLWGSAASSNEISRYRLVHRSNHHLTRIGGIKVHNDHGHGYRLALDGVAE
jgi:DNA-binding response OmpR family regulator